MAANPADFIEIDGDVQVWGVGEHSRRFVHGVLPYRLARRAFRPELYDAVKGRGEQRPQIIAHVRSIARDIAAGQFTPTPVAVGTRKAHAKAVQYEFGRAHLEVDPDNPLPLTDGQQRFGAIDTLLEAAKKAGNADLVKQTEELPIPFILHVDGNTQLDFLNLQKGKNVETSHLMSLAVQQGLLKGKDGSAVALAQEIARELHTTPASPFHKYVRFDSKGSKMQIPVTTLCARSASDLGTSLVGLAKVGEAMGVTDPKTLAGYVVATWKTLQTAPGLIGEGYPLCPPPEGTKGGATLIVGLAVCLAYRLKNDQRTQPDADDLDRLLEVALSTFMVPLRGAFSAADKRVFLKEFAEDFLGGCLGERHQGLTVELQTILAPSAFGNSALPKTTKSSKGAAATAGTPGTITEEAEPADAAEPELEEAIA